LERLKNWNKKIWSCAPRDSDLIGTVLARPSSNSKLQTLPLVRQAPQIINPKLSKENFKEKEKLVMGPDGGLTPG
jgi:hypothetical protein